MIFYSVQFPFYVGFSLLAYSYLLPSLRQYFVLLIGLVWYASFNPAWPLYLLAIAAINFHALRWLMRTNRAHGFPFLVALNVTILAVVKGAGGLDLFGARIVTPYGTSFFFCMMISHVVDRWRKTLPGCPTSFREFALSVSFFPLLVGGPIERQNKLAPQLAFEKPLLGQDVIDGTLIFAFGVLKKFYIANALAATVTRLWGMSLGPAGLALTGVAATFYAYFELSSFCDMGRGVARCFGVKVSDNFRPLCFSKNPNDYWQRWNITLGTFVRDYVTFPLLLRYGRRINRPAMLTFSFLLIGLWHGLELHWLAFGLWNGVILVAYYLMQNSRLARQKRIFGVVGVALAGVILVGNGILQHPSSLTYLGNCLSARDSLGKVFKVVCEAGLLLPLAVGAIVDYRQEKTGKLDFYLELPRGARTLLALLFLGWFARAIDLSAFSGPIGPSEYFRF